MYRFDFILLYLHLTTARLGSGSSTTMKSSKNKNVFCRKYTFELKESVMLFPLLL